MKRLLYLSLIFILSSVCYIQASPSPESDIELLTGRYIRKHTIRKADPVLVEQNIRTMKADGSWEDIDYVTVTNHFAAARHLDRLVNMTLAYYKEDSPYHHAPELLDKILRGIDYFYETNPISHNWWHNVIGAPQKYMVVLLLLKEKIDKQVLLHYSSYLKDDTGNKAHKGKNRTWVSTITLYKGCIEDNYSLVKRGFESVASTIDIVTAHRDDGLNDEGIKIDYSIHQHRGQLYSGGYGMSYLDDIADYLQLAKGTGFESLFTPEKRALLTRVFLQGQVWFGFRKGFDFGTVGRGLSRPGGLKNISPALLELMMENDPKHADTYFAWKKHITENAISPVTGNKHFWKSDIMVHHGTDYYLSAKINSQRTNGTEMLNGENLKGFYLPLGATNIMTNGNEYKDIFPVWDWTKIPGTTASVNQDSTQLKRYHFGTNEFGGGVSNSKNGIIAYEHDYRGIAAKKAYFFIDDFMVCLGTGITSGLPDGITTSVDQSFLQGDVWLNDGNTRKMRKESRQQSNTLKWVHHNQIGYIFPDPKTVTVQNQQQKGAWHEICENGSKEKLSREIFSCWIDHGKQPSSDSYFYIVAPSVPVENMPSIATNHGFEILQNNKDMQVIRNRKKNCYALVFYQPGTIELDEFTFTSGNSLIVYIEILPEEIEISLADPLYKEKMVAIEITPHPPKGKTESFDRIDSRVIGIELAPGDLQGQTVTIKRSKSVEYKHTKTEYLSPPFRGPGGLTGDGVTDNTEILQQLINECSKNSGTLVIPAGKYVTKPLFLESNVHIHLQAGAVLMGSTDLNDYHSVFPEMKGKNTPALLYAKGKENISVTGLGSIDGRGYHANFQHGNDALGGPLRPKLIYFVDCKNVTVQDITLTNPAFWTQDYENCDGVTIRGIKVYAHANWNNDGLDIDSKNVVVSDCYIDCDDDALCFKSDIREPCQNVVVTNCILKSNCNAIKFGTASLSGFKNITISNCVIQKASEDNIRQWHIKEPWMGTTDRSVISGIALESVDGGIIDQIHISNIVMSDVQTPVFIRLGDRRRLFTNQVSTLKNIQISNLTATASSKVACSITGVPGHTVENVSFRDIRMTTIGGGTPADMETTVPENEKGYPENRMFGTILPASGFYIRHAKNIRFENVELHTLTPDSRPLFYLDDTENITYINCYMNNEKQ